MCSNNMQALDTQKLWLILSTYPEKRQMLPPSHIKQRASYLIFNNIEIENEDTKS